MKKLNINIEVKKAILLGMLCAVSYFAVYIFRNVLGAVSPQMIEKGIFNTKDIGAFSSLFFITYACGQLINGVIGDKIKAKYMLGFGLLLAGVSSLVFTCFCTNKSVAYIAYACSGFFLSMIFGPMTKVVAENVDLLYVPRCSLSYEFAALLGSPAAGLLAALMAWGSVFMTSSVVLLVMGIVCLLVFTLFEKKGMVKFSQYAPPAKKSSGLKLLIKHRIIRFTFISIITGIVRTTVVFWLPTYISQKLGFSAEMAALIFSVVTIGISTTSFIAVFIYEKLKRNMDLTILISFSSAAIFFVCVFFVKQPFVNVAFMMLAIMGSNCAAAMLWSRYCPSLRDTGMVSSATGFLDFVSYMSAAISSALFANAVNSIGWDWLIVVWFALMICGIIVALPSRKQQFVEIMS